MKTILTKDGLTKIQDEIKFLMTSETTRLIEELSGAKDRGGVDENSEYELAKGEYERLQIRISKLKDMVANSIIISTDNVDTSKVSILTTVRVLNKTYNREMDFTIVPEIDIDLKSNKISPSSPIGSGLMNKVVGDISQIKTPGGLLELEILEISAN